MKYRLIQQLETWGTLLLEDTSTRRLSIQMLCGSHGMYEHHVALSEEDARNIDADTFDAARFVHDVCSGSIQRDVLPAASMDTDIEDIDKLDLSLWR